MKRLLISSLAVVTVLTFGAGGALADGDDHGWQGDWKSGPVGAWKFDKAFQDPAGTGPDLTPDASGNGNNGQFNGDAKLLAGKKRNALSLDGDGDFVEVLTNSTFDITDELTLEAWVNAVNFDLPPDQGDANIYIISKDTIGGRSYGIGVSAILCGNPEPRAFMIAFTSGGNAIACGDTDLVTGTYYHIAGTYDAAIGTATVYLNGAADGSASVASGSTINVGAANVQIGAREYDGFRAFFNGRIDDACIWNRVRSDEEILASADMDSRRSCARRHKGRDHDDKDRDHDHDKDRDHNKEHKHNQNEL